MRLAARRREDHPLELDVVPVLASVGAAKVERIVENLVGNAVKHTPPGTPIAVRVAPNGDGVLISVEDDGPGIPADASETVFHLFTRGAGREAECRAPGSASRSWSSSRGCTAARPGSSRAGPGGGASFRVRLPADPPGAHPRG